MKQPSLIYEYSFIVYDFLAGDIYAIQHFFKETEIMNYNWIWGKFTDRRR